MLRVVGCGVRVHRAGVEMWHRLGVGAFGEFMMLGQSLEILGCRVRIRLHADRPCDGAPHAPVEDGQTGVAIGEGRVMTQPSHTILVAFDRDVVISVPVGGQLADVPIRTRFFSVDELVVLGERQAEAQAR